MAYRTLHRHVRQLFPRTDASQQQRMRIDVDTKAEPLGHRERYLLLDQIFSSKH